VTENASDALKFVAEFPVEQEIVCVSGSLYLVGEVRKILADGFEF
jgi:folylpolyglutamate synthase/dihydropteroate synthase